MSTARAADELRKDLNRIALEAFAQRWPRSMLEAFSDCATLIDVTPKKEE